MRNDCSTPRMLGPVLVFAALASASGCAKSEPVPAEPEAIEKAVTDANEAAASMKRKQSGR